MIEQFVPRSIGPKPWGEELLIAHTSHYTGKVLRMVAGHQGGLQYHREKDETFYLFSGSAIVRFDDGGTLHETVMSPGMSFHIPPGEVHQVEALTDCVFFETSTPHFEDRVNVGARYGRSIDGQSR